MSGYDEIDRMLDTDPLELMRRYRRSLALIEDFATAGCRHDLNPTHVRLGEGPSGGWERYIKSMDTYVRGTARWFLDGLEDQG